MATSLIGEAPAPRSVTSSVRLRRAVSAIRRDGQEGDRLRARRPTRGRIGDHLHQPSHHTHAAVRRSCRLVLKLDGLHVTAGDELRGLAVHDGVGVDDDLLDVAA